jgi:hypothetical protein
LARSDLLRRRGRNSCCVSRSATPAAKEAAHEERWIRYKRCAGRNGAATEATPAMASETTAKDRAELKWRLANRRIDRQEALLPKTC